MATYTSQGGSRTAHFLPQRSERVRTRRKSGASASSFGFARPARPGFAGDRTSFMSTDSGYFESELDDEEVPSPASPTQQQIRQKKDEPMSPVAVVLYVVFFYVVWQILTRSDDTEILEHLPSTSPLLSSASHAPSYERTAPSHQPYQLPYALQHIPSPIPSTNAESTSTWRMVLGTMVYPIYIAVTLIAIPLPFLINAFNLLMSIVNSILYPITSTFRLLARTFVIAPLTVVLGFLNALYPVYVFVGGIVGAGAFLGVAFGWIGRVLLSFLLRPRSTERRRKSQRSKPKRTSSSSARAPSSERKKAPEPIYTSTPHSKRHSMPPQPTDYTPVKSNPTRSRPTSGSYERRYVPIVDVIELEDGAYLPYEQSHTTARPGVVFGVRRRGTRG